MFWDTSNWQGMCEACHNAKTAREDGRWGGISKTAVKQPSTQRARITF